MAIKEFPGHSNVWISELVGCTESMVRRFLKNEESSGSHSANQSEKVLGKDGKLQARHKKAALANTGKSSDKTKGVAKDHDEATGNAPNTQESLVDNGREDAEDGDQGSAPKPEEVKTTPMSKTEEDTLEVAETTPSPAVMDIVTENTLCQYHLKFFNEVPEDDEKRLKFSELIVRHVLLGKFNNEQCRRDLVQRIEALLEKIGPK